MKEKRSFLSDSFGRQTYDWFKDLAVSIALIGTAVLGVLYALSHFVHSGFVSYLINLTNGYSLLFIGYIVALIILFDFEVEIDEPKQTYWGQEKEPKKPFKYKLTVVWGIVLLLLGIIAVYYSNKYRRHYSFECDSFLVDKKAGIYHLDWNDDCSIAEDADNLEEMQGFQIAKSFKFCEECEEYLDEMESEGR